MQKWTPAHACSEYRLSVKPGICEISHLIMADREAASWIKKQIDADKFGSYRPVVHHLFGRSKRQPQTNWFCSLIQIWDVCHKWLHDQCPSKGDICCLKAKVDRWRELESKYAMHIDNLWKEERRYWNPPVMDRICGAVNLEGRISILMEKNRDTIYEKYAEDVLSYLEKWRLRYA